ncbi:RICIN domain-containing protein [Myxococcus hansupus]|uniref:RICIN domain-containing protein n=1 Tax=Pseudomyxococcus hansupus TaxID=1297742 RepID=UPI001314EA7B|nr:RICIN domain-containing protein [Myxococcus hansupus]
MRENRSSVKGKGWAALALLLLPLTAAAGPGPNYRWDESRNRPGPNRCHDASQCDGARTCSPAGWCQGEARPTPPPPPPPGRGHGGRDREPGRGEPHSQRSTLIRSKLAGLVIDIQGANRAPGARLIAHRAKSHREGNENQLWELVPTRGGYLIRSRLNGLVLDVEGASTNPGTGVVTWEAHGQPNQVWQLVPGRARGTYYIQSQLNGMVLDIEGAQTNGSGRLIIYPMKRNADAANQLWQLDI